MNFENVDEYAIREKLNELPDIVSQGMETLMDNINAGHTTDALEDVTTLLSVLFIEIEELKNDTHRTKG